MRTIYLLLIAVYASIATSTAIDVFFQGFRQDDKQIRDAFADAVSTYEAYTASIGEQRITVYNYPKIHSVRCSRSKSAVYWGSGQRTEQWDALWAISQVIGVGQTGTWNVRCNRDGTLHWGMVTNLLNQLNKSDTTLSCDKHNFWPYGMIFDEDRDIDHAVIHVQLVEAMVKRGLQDY